MTILMPKLEGRTLEDVVKWAERVTAAMERDELQIEDDSVSTGASVPVGTIITFPGVYPVDTAPLMTADNLPAPWVVAARSTLNASYAAWKVRNGTSAGDTDRWLSQNPPHLDPQWWRITFPFAVTMETYTIYGNVTSPGQNPKTWTFEGSNDGTTWDVLASEDLTSGWVGTEGKTFGVTGAISYTQYRIFITASQVAGSNSSIGEVEFAYTPAAPLEGWLPCEGQVVSQTTYQELFAVIASKFNTGGEGAGNFRLPNSTETINGVVCRRIIKT